MTRQDSTINETEDKYIKITTKSNITNLNDININKHLSKITKENNGNTIIEFTVKDNVEIPDILSLFENYEIEYEVY